MFMINRAQVCQLVLRRHTWSGRVGAMLSKGDFQKLKSTGVDRVIVLVLLLLSWNPRLRHVQDLYSALHAFRRVGPRATTSC